LASKRVAELPAEIEVLSMLSTEYDADVAKTVWQAEAMEKGLERGRSEGLERGRSEGLERGRSEGLERGREETARNALAEGFPLHVVQKITGLDVETIQNLQR